MLRLLFDSETEVQHLVRAVRNVWEHDRATKLEVITVFNVDDSVKYNYYLDIYLKFQN